jgi:hypothetical protein
MTQYKTNAKKLIAEMLSCINFDEKPEAWRWLAALAAAVNENVEINQHQEALISTVCGEVSCNWRTKEKKIPSDVFVIAGWINTCGLTSSAHR